MKHRLTFIISCFFATLSLSAFGQEFTGDKTLLDNDTKITADGISENDQYHVFLTNSARTYPMSTQVGEIVCRNGNKILLDGDTGESYMFESEETCLHALAIARKPQKKVITITMSESSRQVETFDAQIAK